MILLEVPVNGETVTVPITGAGEHLVKKLPSMRKGFCVKFVTDNDYFYLQFNQKTTRDEFLRLLRGHARYANINDRFHYKEIEDYMASRDIKLSASELIPGWLDDPDNRSFQEFFKQLIYVFSSQYTLYRAKSILQYKGVLTHENFLHSER